MSVLATKNLLKRFDAVAAVDHLSLSIEAGKITSIIGPNGSGKSTLINLLTGIFPFDAGAVVMGESKLARIAPHTVPIYGLTRTFQDVRLFEQMTVLDNILVVLTDRPIWGAIFEKHNALHLARAKEVLERVGLWPKHDQLAINLSYGQRKLLEIARVLAMIHTFDISIILFDEPFAGLFPEMVKIVTGVLQALKQQGKAVVLVEHNMDLIRQLSDHVFVLDSGELLAEGDPERVLAKREVVEAYLGE